MLFLYRTRGKFCAKKKDLVQLSCWRYVWDDVDIGSCIIAWQHGCMAAWTMHALTM